MPISIFSNPYRPGAGHLPLYLAGREYEKNEFLRLLQQAVIMENMVITGLRGVGKTVLLEALKPIAFSERWLWVGTDLSESTSINEEAIVIRLLADLSVVTSSVPIGVTQLPPVGFMQGESVTNTLKYQTLMQLFQRTPGLMADKLKAVLEVVASAIKPLGVKGVVFAYDEAQNMNDHTAKEQYPLSLMLDAFQSIQRKGIPFMIVFTGLPTLLSKLIDARTYSERMFHVLTLDRLNENDSRTAILTPIQSADCPVKFDEIKIQSIISASGGYPYFIQFICRELYDAYLQTEGKGIAVSATVQKLDADFFAGRWSRVTDRQRQLLWVVANLENSDAEFTAGDVSDKSKLLLSKSFSRSHIIQIFNTLSEAGLIFRNRFGKYSFAVPLLGHFIMRQAETNPEWIR